MIEAICAHLSVAFNTGAPYGSHGQRIAVWIHRWRSTTDLCCFVDFDRQIHGHFPVRANSAITTPGDLAKHALHMYRWGQYGHGGAELSTSPGLEPANLLSAVMAAGYDAFASSPAVKVLDPLQVRLLMDSSISH